MSWLLKNIFYKKIAKCSVFVSIIFFGLFILYNFGNAQYIGQYMTPFGGNVRPGIDAQFPAGLSIYSPYESQILGYNQYTHPIFQLGLEMQNLGLSLPPGYGGGIIYGSPFSFGNTIVMPYIIPGVGGGTSSTSLGYSGYGGLYGDYSGLYDLGGYGLGGHGLYGLGGYGGLYGLGSMYGGYGGLYGLGSMYGGYGGWYGF